MENIKDRRDRLGPEAASFAWVKVDMGLQGNERASCATRCCATRLALCGRCGRAEENK